MGRGSNILYDSRKPLARQNLPASLSAKQEVKITRPFGDLCLTIEDPKSRVYVLKEHAGLVKEALSSVEGAATELNSQKTTLTRLKRKPPYISDPTSKAGFLHPALVALVSPPGQNGIEIRALLDQKQEVSQIQIKMHGANQSITEGYHPELELPIARLPELIGQCEEIAYQAKLKFK